MIKRDVSNFDVDTGTALWALKAAIEKGGFTRAAINTAIETKLKGFVTPGGKLRFSTTNHTGLNIDSMWAGQISNCKPKPVFGAAFGVVK
jgi:ABC-type branched-subunit amino acid transport system substrate-binding protein